MSSPEARSTARPPRLITSAMAKVAVFIHGMWGTPNVWRNWRPAFEARGWLTQAPALRHQEADGGAVQVIEEPQRNCVIGFGIEARAGAVLYPFVAVQRRHGARHGPFEGLAGGRREGQAG